METIVQLCVDLETTTMDTLPAQKRDRSCVSPGGKEKRPTVAMQPVCPDVTRRMVTAINPTSANVDMDGKDPTAIGASNTQDVYMERVKSPSSASAMKDGVECFVIKIYNFVPITVRAKMEAHATTPVMDHTHASVRPILLAKIVKSN